MAKAKYIPVITAHDYDSQWYTLHKNKVLLHDPTIAELILNKDDTLEYAYKIEEYCEQLAFEVPRCDVTTLRVDFLPITCKFDVKFIDGWETIVIEE